MEGTLGVIIPNKINDEMERLQNVLKDCQPYNDEDLPENIELIETGIEVGNELVRFLVAIKEYRNKHIVRETSAVRIHHNAFEMFNLLRDIETEMIASTWQPPWKDELEKLMNKIAPDATPAE